MSHWIHLNLFFKNWQQVTLQTISENARVGEKPSGFYRDLVSYLDKVIHALPEEDIGRYFFLFEPNPNLFMAIEHKNDKNLDVLERNIKGIDRPNFIESIDIKRDTGDEGHAKAVLDFFHASTKYAFYRISQSYQPGYENNDEVKLVHCFCNQLYVDSNNEINFYQKCLEHRGLKVTRS